MQTRTLDDGRKRVVIEGVEPEIDGGRFPIKRVVGEKVEVEADVFTDGHDQITCLLQYRKDDHANWHETPMKFLINDRWRGEFSVQEPGTYRYTVSAWVDGFKSWRHDLKRRTQAKDIAVALLVGARLIEDASQRASGDERKLLEDFVTGLRSEMPLESRRNLALDSVLGELMMRYPDRRFASQFAPQLPLLVDRLRARFSSWYELFPRSCSAEAGRHGTFKDVEARLADIATMGFDVLYLPPIHPIGRTKRKGQNNSLTAKPGDPGSPWAIGATEGGHKDTHPDLGSLEDFDRLVSRARELGIEVGMDIAFQCAPDHPYVKEHPSWFRKRPDGSVQYAENPPKRYEDIYPFDFESSDWQSLWEELRSIFLFWIERGVRVFRVDNPHTKPFPMWEWIIGSVKKDYPDVIFLAEAFTRPKVMHRLAKLGFTQSYTYFSWRNSKWELTEYMKELTEGKGAEYFRPNFWPNTPDILTEFLQFGGRPAFMSRFVLAATMSSNYGIYGPAYELCEKDPREDGSEEYLNSEKYQIRRWDLDHPESLKHFIRRINQIRRDNPALQHTSKIAFYPVDNQELICFGKWDEEGTNVVIVLVNIDPFHAQSGWVELPLDELALDPKRPYQMHDLLSDNRYLWHGARNFVELDPKLITAHIFRLRRRVRTERDFDYFL